jgi:hypothetical protein
MGNRDGARLGGFGRGNTFGWGVVQGSGGGESGSRVW